MAFYQANHGAHSNPGALVGGPQLKKDFDTVLQKDLTGRLVPSGSQAI